MPARLLLAAAVIATAAMAASAPAWAGGRTVPHGFFGTTWDREALGRSFGDWPGDWGRMAASGVESLRVNFFWRDAQPRRGGPIDLSFSDVVVSLAAQHRISLLPIVLGPPTWARRHPRILQSPPRRPSEYAAYLRALVRRYGSRGTFWSENPTIPRRPVEYWQIANEPTLIHHWYRAPGDDDWERPYGALVRAAHAVLRREDPRAKLVLAGLPNYSWRDLASLHRTGGIRGHFDVAAFHPFTRRPEDTLRLAQLFRGVLRRNGGGRIPIWVTEMSWPASVGRTRPPRGLSGMATTERGAAARLTRAYDLLATEGRRRHGVGRVFWYTWASDYAGADFFEYAGLMQYGRRGARATPMLAAYVAAARRRQGCEKTPQGTCRVLAR